MTRALAYSGAALLIAAAASSAWPRDAGLANAAATLAAAEVLQQRKDIDEVSKPLPPSGPATPIPFCSPGSPICP